MAFPASNTFETGQAPGTTITNGNSGGAAGAAWDSITGTCTYETTPAHGTLGAKILVPGASSFAHINWTSSTLGTFTECWGRVYIRFPALPPVQRNRFVSIDKSGVANGAEVSLEGSGDIRVWDSTGSGFTAAGVTLAVDTWYRIEWHYLASTTVGAITANIYVGDSTTQLGTVTRSGVNTLANADQTAFGGTFGEEGGAFTIYLDDINVNGTGFPGPANKELLELEESADLVLLESGLAIILE